MSQSESPGDSPGNQSGGLRRQVEYAQERASALGGEIRERGGEPSVPDDIGLALSADLDGEQPVEEQLDRDLSGDDAIALRKRLSALEQLISSWETALDDREQEIHEKFAEAVENTPNNNSNDEWSREPGTRLAVDVGSIATYMSYVVTEIDTNDDFSKTLFKEIVAVIKENVNSEEDIHKASAVLWNILVKHEDNYFDE